MDYNVISNAGELNKVWCVYECSQDVFLLACFEELTVWGCLQLPPSLKRFVVGITVGVNFYGWRWVVLCVDPSPYIQHPPPPYKWSVVDTTTSGIPSTRVGGLHLRMCVFICLCECVCLCVRVVCVYLFV